MYSSIPNPASAGAEERQVKEVTGFFSSVEDKYGLWFGCYASRLMSFMPSGPWEGAGGNGLDNERNRLLVGVRGPVDLLRKLVYWVHW
jgi:hypothetical protein